MEGYSSCAFAAGPESGALSAMPCHGYPAVEYVLDQGLPYVFRAGNGCHVHAFCRSAGARPVAGTHGKPLPSSVAGWISLSTAGSGAGFPDCGVAADFGGVSACLGGTPFFVVEADEYEVRFFGQALQVVHLPVRARGAEQSFELRFHADNFSGSGGR